MASDPYPYAKIGISKGPYCFVLQIISCRLHHNICGISLVSIFHNTGIKTNTLYYLLPLLYFYVFLGMNCFTCLVKNSFLAHSYCVYEDDRETSYVSFQHLNYSFRLQVSLQTRVDPTYHHSTWQEEQ